MKAIFNTHRLFCTSNLAFRAIAYTEARQQVESSIPDEVARQKLDALANVLGSLNNAEVQYLVELQNKRLLEQGGKIS